VGGVVGSIVVGFVVGVSVVGVNEEAFRFLSSSFKALVIRPFKVLLLITNFHSPKSY